MQPAGRHRFGTVGRPIPGVEVRLAEDGELLVRGAIVMRATATSPRRPPRRSTPTAGCTPATSRAIDDDGYVWIVDRKKELIINAAGKNMSPANIESALKAAGPLIGQACVIGERRPYNVALLVLDPEARAAGDSGRRPATRRASGVQARGRRGQRPPLAGGADQAVRAAAGGVAARRRRADPDDEAQAPADRARSTPSEIEALYA